MGSTSKAQLLTDVYNLLRKRYKLGPRDETLSVLEAVLYGICHEGATREQANQALSRFRDDFFDWNEVRVSSLPEIQGVLAGLPDREGKAHRLRRFLRQIFDKTYGFDLDGLAKKPLKEAAKALPEFEALTSDYVLATVIQQALGGHAIPVDEPMRRGLARLGVAEPDADAAALRATLERAVPKNRGAEFVDLMAELTHDTCVEGPPDCGRCDLAKICPTGIERLAEARSAARAETKAAATKPARPAKSTPAPAKESPSAKASPHAKAATPSASSKRKSPPRSK